MSEHPDHPDVQGAVDQAMDLVLYAPLGFALEARRLLPTFVARGRQQVQMARLVGQFAVGQGRILAQDRVSRAQGQAEAVLAELGLRPPVGGGGPAGPRPVDPAPTGAPDHREPPGGAPRVAPAEPAPRSGAGAAQLAIADYDSLAASQVIPRLAGLEASELEAVRAYELAHRGRKTVLGKISQLQGA